MLMKLQVNWFLISFQKNKIQISFLKAVFLRQLFLCLLFRTFVFLKNDYVRERSY